MLEESEKFSINLRGVLKEKGLKIFSQNDEIFVSKMVNFDIASKEISSINLFCQSIISEIILAFKNELKSRKIEIFELEGTGRFLLKNPLFILGVKGYENKPKISEIYIKIYGYLGDEAGDEILSNALAKCPIYQTLREVIKFQIDLKCE